MDDPVPDGVDGAEAADRVGDLGRVCRPARGRQVRGPDQRVVGTEHPQLEAAGAGVDDEDPAGGGAARRAAAGA